MKLKSFLPFIILLLLLTGCQTPATPAAPTATPTQAATIEQVAIVEQAATVEQVVVVDPIVVDAPLVEESPTTVPTPTLPTQTPEPTPIAWEDLPALVMAASKPETLFTSVSPDGNWQVDLLRYDCVMVDHANGAENAYEQLILTRLSDGTQAVAAEQVQYCGGLGAFGLNDLYWSSNSRYYYFDEARQASPDGYVCGFWNNGFSRIDVETGQRESLPGNGQVFNTQGILLGWERQELVLWDLNENEIGRLPFVEENYILQSIQFSPADNRFVYILRENCTPEMSRTVVVLVSLADLSSTILLDSTDPGYHHAMWENATTLILVDANGAQWRFDLTTNSLIPVTPTAP